ncbi:MAG: 30S ribosomal protein S6 [Corynebacterium sp.]|uniref:30S ribosomal protein S6 n=1 Tax=Corynebacterium sp. TaxID=1720 RepID=UPI003F92957C
MRSVRQYEMMIIVDPSQDERTVAPSLDKFLETVRKENGTVDKVDIWGKRRLEFPINKQEEGIYAVVDLNCESATVQELDRLLNLNDIIMRTKVLRKDAK